MDKTEVVREILRFNKVLDPRRVALKLSRMREGRFAFFRGTCHLFYRGFTSESVLDKSPLAWICGDLHLENFGSYKGDNRLAYFDMNDFDEACLAPCAWEALRMLVSILAGADDLKIGEAEAMVWCRVFLERYRRELRSEKPRWIERSLSKGLIRNLLKTVGREDRGRFLDTRTLLKGKKRTLRIDGKKALPTGHLEREMVLSHVEVFAREQEGADFYRVLDVADRISGLGSLGVSRFVVLVEGRGSPDGNFLLDLKEARPSAASGERLSIEPQWSDEADRVVAVQKRSQAIPPALLGTLQMNGRSYILKELQPSEHRVDLGAWGVKTKSKKDVIDSMGALSAWGQLRCADFRQAAPSEDLMAFGDESGWETGLLDLAVSRSRFIQKAFSEYCTAYDEGVFREYMPSPAFLPKTGRK